MCSGHYYEKSHGRGWVSPGKGKGARGKRLQTSPFKSHKHGVNLGGCAGTNVHKYMGRNGSSKKQKLKANGGGSGEENS